MSATAGYSGTPLPTKLGIRPGGRVLLDGPPGGPELGALPDRVTVHRRPGAGTYDVVLLVAPSASRLRERWPRLAPRLATAGRLWVCWPKKSAGVVTDLSEGVVREFGLAQGLVDVKVCAVDATWSGLAFARRRQVRRDPVRM
jgi:hypothetical protein